MNERTTSTYLAMILFLALLAASLVVVPRIVGAQRLPSGEPLQGGQASGKDEAFSYEGNLTVKGQPADGLYDIKFSLHSDIEGGDALGREQVAQNVRVRGGAFSVPLDFGDLSGANSPYLQISVRPSGEETAFTVLSPRQAVSLSGANSGAAGATSREVWRLGFTSEGSADYSAVIGRVAGDVAAFRSQQATDIYYIFPAPGTSKTIQAAYSYLLGRTGSYSGSATLALEVIRFDGTLQHSVSTGAIDVAAAATGDWTAVELSSIADDLQVAPGEFLAFHFKLDGASGGNLDVRALFQVEVE